MRDQCLYGVFSCALHVISESPGPLKGNRSVGRPAQMHQGFTVIFGQFK